MIENKEKRRQDPFNSDKFTSLLREEHENLQRPAIGETETGAVMVLFYLYPLPDTSRRESRLSDYLPLLILTTFLSFPSYLLIYDSQYLF